MTQEKSRKICEIIEKIMISTISACMCYDPLLERSRYKALTRKEQEQLLKRIQVRAKEDMRHILHNDVKPTAKKHAM